MGLHWLALWRQVRGRRWGLGLDLRGSRLARVLSARRRAVRRPLSPALGPAHKVLEAARVLRLEDDPPSPFLFTGPETEAEAAALLKPEAPGQDGPILAMSPAADWVGKAWPAERFGMVAAELLGPAGPLPNGRLMLVGGSDDRWAMEAVRRAIARERLIDLVGKGDLLTTYACLERARLFIGNDSPYQHLAAAAGAPTLSLFGPSDERVYGPWGPRALALRGPRDFDAFRAIDPTFSQAINHMQDLTIAKVTAAARRLMAETEPAQVAPDPPQTDAEKHD
jgi:ADP-heptose:LPS heptosyltransferase